MKNSALTWFEVPSRDFDRAVDFYSTILGKSLQKMDFNGIPNGIFPYDPDGGVGGAVVYDAQYEPSMTSAIIYLNAGQEGELDAMLNRVPEAGGQVLMPKTHIGEPGYIALIADTEGNRIGLNAPNGS